MASTRKTLNCSVCNKPVRVATETEYVKCSSCMQTAAVQMTPFIEAMRAYFDKYVEPSSRIISNHDRLRLASIAFRSGVDIGLPEYTCANLENGFFVLSKDEHLQISELPWEYTETKHHPAQGKVYTTRDMNLKLTFPPLGGNDPSTKSCYRTIMDTLKKEATNARASTAPKPTRGLNVRGGTRQVLQRNAGENQQPQTRKRTPLH